MSVEDDFTEAVNQAEQVIKDAIIEVYAEDATLDILPEKIFDDGHIDEDQLNDFIEAVFISDEKELARTFPDYDSKKYGVGFSGLYAIAEEIDNLYEDEEPAPTQTNRPAPGPVSAPPV